MTADRNRIVHTPLARSALALSKAPPLGSHDAARSALCQQGFGQLALSGVSAVLLPVEE